MSITTTHPHSVSHTHSHTYTRTHSRFCQLYDTGWRPNWQCPRDPSILKIWLSLQLSWVGVSLPPEARLFVSYNIIKKRITANKTYLLFIRQWFSSPFSYLYAFLCTFWYYLYSSSTISDPLAYLLLSSFRFSSNISITNSYTAQLYCQHSPWCLRGETEFPKRLISWMLTLTASRICTWQDQSTSDFLPSLTRLLKLSF